MYSWCSECLMPHRFSVPLVCTYVRGDKCRVYNNSINSYAYKLVFMDKPNTNYLETFTACLLWRCAAQMSWIESPLKLSSHFHGTYLDPGFMLGFFPVSFKRYIPLRVVEVKRSLSTPRRYMGEVKEYFQSFLTLSLDEGERLTPRPARLSPAKEPYPTVWVAEPVWNIQSTVEPQFTKSPVHEQFGSRTNFPRKKSRMTNVVSDYEHAGWQHRQAERIGAGVSVAG
jgi:hypothetical protein